MADPFAVPRPPGSGRAWLLALFAIIFGIIVGVSFTKDRTTSDSDSTDTNAVPGAGDWAHGEKAEPIATAAPSPEPTPPPPTKEEHAQWPSYRPEQPCQQCLALQQLMVQSDASPMTVKGNTLELKHDNDSKAMHVKPGPPHAIWADHFLYAILLTAIDTDMPGDVLATISQDMRDSATLAEVLVPHGSILHGTLRQQHDLNLNNQSVMIDWQSLQLPNGFTMALPQEPTIGIDGYPGMRGEFDRHLARTYGATLITSLATAAAMIATTPTYGSYQGYSSESMAFGQFGGSLANGSAANLAATLQAMKPTIKIPKGTVLRVLVTKDLPFDGPYQDGHQ